MRFYAHPSQVSRYLLREFDGHHRDQGPLAPLDAFVDFTQQIVDLPFGSLNLDLWVE